MAGLESLSLDNEEEKDHFFNLIANDNQVNTLKFISLGGLQLGNDYVWLNNYQKFNYPIPWSPREPSGPCKAEHCMCIEIISKKVVGFNNYGCSTLTLPFFCQSAKTGTVTPNFKSNESVEDSQLCQAITNTLNSAKENEDNKIINSTEVTNSGSRKYKTTTISVSTTEYEY